GRTTTSRSSGCRSWIYVSCDTKPAHRATARDKGQKTEVSPCDRLRAATLEKEDDRASPPPKRRPVCPRRKVLSSTWPRLFRRDGLPEQFGKGGLGLAGLLDGLGLFSVDRLADDDQGD